MATLDRKFGPFVLEETNGVSVARFAPKLLASSQFTPRQQGHGSLFLSQALEGVEIALAGDLHGTTADQTRTRLDALMAALTNGEQYLQEMSGRRILCRLADGVNLDPEQGGLHFAYKWSATLQSRWPTWEALTPVEDVFDWTTTVQTETLTANAGEAPAWPRIVLTENGPGFTGRQIIIVNTSTDAQLSLQGVSMNSGQSLSIDMREGRIHDGLSGEIEVLGIEGAPFSLSPAAAHTLELQVNLPSPNFGVVVARHDQYWAP